MAEDHLRFTGNAPGRLPPRAPRLPRPTALRSPSPLGA